MVRHTFLTLLMTLILAALTLSKKSSILTGPQSREKEEEQKIPIIVVCSEYTLSCSMEPYSFFSKSENT